jgi:ATP-dependent exoDNAse (exonuclease V) beta subunit
VAELLRFPSSPDAPPPDAEARREALDIRRSFIVEAPAGSGKTGLLIQRLLKLLADDSVEQPEQVLAITFTNKATAEMRDRVLAHLAAAQSGIAAQSTETAEPEVLSQLAAASSEPLPAENDFQTETRELAHAVLTRDRQLGWNLLDQPHRLNIRTIDSVCAQIARTLPVLSGSGGRLTPTTDAGPLHREAARRTLLLLGSGDAAFDAALRNLLLHRDGNLTECESLLANMLSLRDQWGDLIPLTHAQLDEAWLDANVLPRLELALDHAIRASLTPLAQAFPADLLANLTSLAADLAPAAPYNPEVPSPIALCANLRTPPEPIAAALDHWIALLHLLTTSSGKMRKERGLTSRNLKFDYNRKLSSHSRLAALLNSLRDRDDLLLTFEKIRALPPAHYPADQWAVAKSLFRVLGRALVELQLVFTARNQCDFTELSLLARQALASDSGADDLAAALGARLQHLLVDEMQDTSTTQYDLIQLLTASWDSYGQTVFLVGDPRQSIYLFRQARVERFIRAMHTQRLGDLPLALLRLTANFRSQSILVDQFNHDFSLIFPNEADPAALPYAEVASTLPPAREAEALVWHANPISTTTDSGAGADAPEPVLSLSKDLDSETWVASADAPLTAAQLKQQQARRDALEVRRIVSEWLTKPLPPGRTEPWRIAVLVRSRNHLNEIVATLKQEDAIPFRAVEIESLGQRQEVLDLTALTRALLHPADRVAALALLRAPWCGLSLADLHTLTGCDDPSLQSHSIQSLMAERGHLLPEDSIQRLQRVWQALTEAAAQRARLTHAQLVERAWRSLGGDAWLTQPELDNANRFFQLMDKLQLELEENRTANLLDPTLLESRLQALYAEPNPIPTGTPFVELLTIHKAKGLEWDVVLVPALERQPATDRSRLLTWSELEPPDSSADRAAHFMLAPIAGRGEPSKALNNWLNGIHRAREAAERKRLFYVACTRARQELHLFAAPQLTSSGEINPRYDSLLQAAWPAAEAHFAAAETAIEQENPSSRPEVAHFAAGVEGPPHFSPHTTEPEPFNLDLAASAAPSHCNLQRLPLAFDPATHIATARAHKLPYGDSDSDPVSSPAQFSRPEGSFAARSFGNVVHAALESLATRIATGQSPEELLAELPTWLPRIAALLRAEGLPHATVNRLARETLTALENTLRDPDGLWLLAPNSCAASEFALTAWPAPASPAEQSAPAATRPTSIRPVSIRIDRIFRAGPAPHAPGEDFLWIVDYKTSAPHSSASLDDFLNHQRAAYAPQLETYARILTQFPHPADRPAPKEVRLALYNPALPHLLWWPFTAPSA